ncbi:hypothetical protein [Arcobacter sp.]|uniref:pirin family protein n=1 Tax=unclassified Arcobacter TaxID=2593671 RepID=UPI003B002303
MHFLKVIKKSLDFTLNKGRQVYFVQIEGSSTINSIEINERDTMEITKESNIQKAIENSHFLFIKMKEA